MPCIICLNWEYRLSPQVVYILTPHVSRSAAMSDAVGSESLAKSSDGDEQDKHMKKSISNRAAVSHVFFFSNAFIRLSCLQAH